MDTELLNFMGTVMPFITHNSDITENFFIYVYNNPEARNTFRILCNKYGSDNVKKRLGRLIRETYNLPNTGKAKSKSGLIGTYTKH